MKLKRRDFLKMVGLTGVTAVAGCSPDSTKKLIPYLIPAEDIVPGVATWYASTCRECPAGCGILAKNREGRVIKVEGNPLHPINQGRICMRGQAAVQGIYNPDRIKTPFLKEKDEWRILSYAEAEDLLRFRIKKAAAKGPNRIRMLTEVVGDPLLNLFARSLNQWDSTGPMVFEPFGYESLKAANEKVFGVKGLPSYHMEKADLLVSLGADFLETWLSPVEYARKFKEMHSFHDGKKGFFVYISPYQSLTGANADLWISCNPGSEAAIALGILREGLSYDDKVRLPYTMRESLKRVAYPFTKEKVIEISGIASNHYEKLVRVLMKSEKPLILGSGASASGITALQTEMAVLLLNLIRDPALRLYDFTNRHRIEIASRRAEIVAFFKSLENDPVDLLLLNNVNPVFSLPPGSGVEEALRKDSLFVVSFSNFMDETSKQANLIFPVSLPLETWDEYGGKQSILSTLQPAMGNLTDAPHLGDVLLRLSCDDKKSAQIFKEYLFAHLVEKKRINDKRDWTLALERGGIFESFFPEEQKGLSHSEKHLSQALTEVFSSSFLGEMFTPSTAALTFIAAPSIRFFDGRGANKPWLCEIPDPVSEVTWHTPVLINPKTIEGIRDGDLVRIESQWGRMDAPAYVTEGVRRGVAVMNIGQGHQAYGRYAERMGLNPFSLLSSKVTIDSGSPLFSVKLISLTRTSRSTALAHTDGSRTQQGRKIALSVLYKDLIGKEVSEKPGLTMKDFPFTLPLPAGYDRKRDFYPPHEHKEYRWVMVVDLDKCIGCSACTAACYAENNVGMVGIERIIQQREMSWLAVQRYHDEERKENLIFFPMLCQHCDNAPCESVCPVFAPNHSKEGINNQVYNRCIGTRFCSQNCPYKVRRFNWFDWKWPEPLNLQLNPDVTVRSKGVMEKCSFCIQRIKEAHQQAKKENRKIRDGEIQPACVQTCPAGVFTFGNLVVKESRVSKLIGDKRAYQAMGYLNTKPAVIYLKKVVQEI